MRKFTLIHFFILLGNFGVPGSAIVLAFLFPQQKWRWFFLTFILFHSFERIWETFFTSHERKVHEFHVDWPLAFVTASYICLCFVVIFEFFLFNKTPKIAVLLMGCIVYLSAFRLRWWGMKSLGSQWSIHAVGAIKLKRFKLLKIGAYKYMRHPVYLGIMLEEIGMPLMWNAFVALAFSVLICLPLVVIRAVMEERSSLRKFGSSFLAYKQEVDMFLPLKIVQRTLTPWQ